MEWMSKISDLTLAVADLKRCGEALICISESLNSLFIAGDTDSQDQSESVAPEPEGKPVSLETVRAVLAEKSRAGHTAEIRALLEKHGAGKLSEIAPAEYPALLEEAEALGNG